MIKLTDKDSVKADTLSAEGLKVMLNKYAYGDDVYFWSQNEDNAYITLSDGNAVIKNNSADICEIKEFLKLISPSSVFSDYDTVSSLFESDVKRLFVYKSDTNSFESDITSDVLSSNEVYKILSLSGLSLPPYEYFAVDYCNRKNNGVLNCFAIKDKCAAIGMRYENTVLISGVASLLKGYGKKAVNGLLSNYENCTAIAVVEDKNRGFYEKCGFTFLSTAGQWSRK